MHNLTISESSNFGTVNWKLEEVNCIFFLRLFLKTGIHETEIMAQSIAYDPRT
jgi:hypothetical protein